MIRGLKSEDSARASHWLGFAPNARVGGSKIEDRLIKVGLLSLKDRYLRDDLAGRQRFGNSRLGVVEQQPLNTRKREAKFFRPQHAIKHAAAFGAVEAGRPVAQGGYEAPIFIKAKGTQTDVEMSGHLSDGPVLF